MAKIKARPFSDLEARMSKAALDESERIYADLREEMALGEIRAASGLSQEEMARRLKVNQAQVSRLEKRVDLKISTLSRVVGALGGRLQVTAKFGGKTVTLKGLPIGTRLVLGDMASGSMVAAKKTAPKAKPAFTKDRSKTSAPVTRRAKSLQRA